MPDIYDRAIRAFGADAQWRMVQEECGELVAAVNRWKRGRTCDEALASEVADVLIVAEQARRMLPNGLVDTLIARKLERLAILAGFAALRTTEAGAASGEVERG